LETELNDEQKDFAKTIKKSSDNLIVIINDILDFSKIKAGKLTIEKIDFNLYEVVESIKAIFKQTLKEKGLTFQVTVSDDIPQILNGDPYRLNQVLVNLVGNALKFTHHGGVDLDISMLRKHSNQISLRFVISDTGIGIEEDKVVEIFESFNQGNLGTSRKYGGTGLGLAICRQLLDLQGGSISVTSQIDQGTVFEFIIPYNDSTTSIPLHYTGKVIKNSQMFLQGKRILVTEDNEINQKVIIQVLKKVGASVVIANNGLEAISNLKKDEHFDLIIMDLQMPVMDGYAATQYIRNVMGLSTPILAMTASAIKDEKNRCLEMGMNDYMTKPFDIPNFYKRLGIILSDTTIQDDVVDIDEPGIPKFFDLSLLEEMDDNEYLIEILSLFLENTPAEIRSLEEALQAEDTDAIYKISHKLKSSVGLLQAQALLQLLERIEKVSKSGSMHNLSVLFGNMKEEYKNIENHLQKHVAQLQLTVTV
jgi:CheY-like chemotaxis protein